MIGKDMISEETKQDSSSLLSVIDLNVGMDPLANKFYPISFHLSNNRQFLLSPISNFSYVYLDTNTFKIIGSINGAHEKKINDMFLDDKMIYSASNDGTLKIWDARDLKLQNTLKAQNKRELYSIGKTEYIVGAGSRGDIYFWDIRTMKSLTKFSETFADDVTKLKFHYAKPGNLLAGSEDGIVCQFDLSQNNEEDAVASIVRLSQPVASCGFFAANPELCHVTTSVGTINVVSLEEAKVLSDFNTIENLETNTEYLIETFTMPEDLNVYYLKGSPDGIIRKYQIPVGMYNTSEAIAECYTQHKTIITSAVQLTDECIITGSEDGTIRATAYKPIIKTPSTMDLGILQKEMFSNQPIDFKSPPKNKKAKLKYYNPY
jgi:WD40 repeat protein